MTTYKYGNPDAPVVLIQPVDAYDLAGMEREVREIRRLSAQEFLLIAVSIENWNQDLSPWEAPPVFGKSGFGDGAKKTLDEITALCDDARKTYVLGGYSLAGLFALWSICQTDAFSAAAAASPSAWFPGLPEYLKTNSLLCRRVYLSLGDREEKTRNPVMATVGARIREICASLQAAGAECVLEWNEGNHFRDPDLRTARAFAWAMNGLSWG